jgi:predicted HicB family RNase H-like nuclease
MNRSTQSEHALRINTAVGLLQENTAHSEAAHMLCSKFGISLRQSYRYINIAKRQGIPSAIPESKKVFTVKLTIDLIEQIRLKARQSGRSISDIVAEALRYFISKRC